MSLFGSRPALRWLVPTAAAVVVIGGGAAAGTIVASADPALPPRSAAQLLVDVQNAHVDGLSGTIVQTADLGLPALPGLTAGNTDLAKMVTGNNSARVWYAGEDKMRVAAQSLLGQTDVIRNGQDVWLWRSKDNTATHLTLPKDADKPKALPSGVPSTPQEAADAALAAIDPTTQVSTTGAAEVAGRDAYELVLAPRDTASLLGQVRLAIDAETHIPLRVDVYAKDATAPAVRVAFQQISFTTPDPQQFVFNPPAGAKVTTAKPHADHTKKPLGAPAGAPKAPAGEEPTVVGKGWTSVLVAKLPDGWQKQAGAKQGEAAMVGAVLDSLPKVSGTWGSGRLLSSALFSALLTDDGRVLVGAVAPDRLYQVAAG
ncbi:outer membrane lipoprotein-sorting protein [Krasilnikovia cinnamomea]|uniref:Outer membrane lipoprotein-sorting protein n=1 Tax=Krasilnikovia cinnamomea TaxID=349313 RepID=A0A4Q7ZTR2_9ACTN|nr:sigma-E factor regulatory protein RseB domain-containing protein [Krasilnikovia cinnamomea]RZU54630.1 outer membrane lipoprotein-sorting protein [Krasilnikovia cinnamomea]